MTFRTVHEGDEVGKMHGTHEREMPDVRGQEHLLLVHSCDRVQLAHISIFALISSCVPGELELPSLERLPLEPVDALLRFDMLWLPCAVCARQNRVRLWLLGAVCKVKGTENREIQQTGKSCLELSGIKADWAEVVGSTSTAHAVIAFSDIVLCFSCPTRTRDVLHHDLPELLGFTIVHVMQDTK